MQYRRARSPGSTYFFTLVTYNVDYIHYNPVHHGLVLSPKDWQYSSFHRYVQCGIYDIDWVISEIPIFDS